MRQERKENYQRVWYQTGYCCVWQKFSSVRWHSRTCFQSCCPCSHSQGKGAGILQSLVEDCLWGVLTPSHFWCVPCGLNGLQWPAITLGRERLVLVVESRRFRSACHICLTVSQFVPWKEHGHSHHLISFYVNIAPPLNASVCQASLLLGYWGLSLLDYFHFSNEEAAAQKVQVTCLEMERGRCTFACRSSDSEKVHDLI